MSSCCAVPGAVTNGLVVCPESRTRGKSVELQTVKALLIPEALQRLNPSGHWFCPDVDCQVVYFDECGHTYSKSDVRVSVWQKEPFGARLVCYCFGENEATMRAELETTGNCRAVERVRTHLEAQRCACEVRNPRGACCLGDVSAAVEHVAAALAAANVTSSRER